jgi:hypothetical protein
VRREYFCCPPFRWFSICGSISEGGCFDGALFEDVH